ncbi:hypothetical protein [Glaciecola sp. 1036]|uniref:hypothetical protein n=1 Tax=Alteromonadaceae TaxID=72275 RepID=UPI003D055782
MKYLPLSALLLSHTALTKEISKDPEISELFATFFESIENKNKDSFLNIFHPINVSWVGVYSEESIKILCSRYGKDVFKPKDVASTPTDFIDNIIKSPFDITEKYYNVSVIEDGNIATLTFDYSYFLGDFKSNWGQESGFLLKQIMDEKYLQSISQ